MRCLLEVEVGERPAHRVAATGLRLVAVAGHRERGARAHRPPRDDLDPQGIHHRALGGGVAIGSGPEAADARIEGQRLSFELDGERDLVGGAHREELLAPQVELGYLDALVVLGSGQAVELVRRAERRVVARVGQRVCHDVRIERSRPRVSLALVDDDANADALDLGRCQRLHVTLERVHVDFEGTHDVGLDLLSGARRTGDGTRDVEEVDAAHALMRPCRPP